MFSDVSLILMTAIVSARNELVMIWAVVESTKQIHPRAGRATTGLSRPAKAADAHNP